MLHALTRFGKYASCLPLDEVDIAATGNQFFCQLLLFRCWQFGTLTCVLVATSYDVEEMLLAEVLHLRGVPLAADKQ